MLSPAINNNRQAQDKGGPMETLFQQQADYTPLPLAKNRALLAEVRRQETGSRLELKDAAGQGRLALRLAWKVRNNSFMGGTSFSFTSSGTQLMRSAGQFSNCWMSRPDSP